MKNVLRILIATWGLYLPALAQSVPSDVGNYYPFLSSYAKQQPMSLSFLSKQWSEVEQWRIQGRAKMLELLAYDPAPASSKPKILDQTVKAGYTRYRVQLPISSNRISEAFLLIPHGLTKPAPAIVAIHDHGGFYYFGKEKITETENSPQILQDFIDRSYGGRTYADELARRGFVVLVPDGFYFGSQRLDPSQLDGRWTKNLKDLDPGSDAYIRAFNRMASGHETLVAKTIYSAGTTWPGILFQGDREAVDYLLTRPEVDSERIGCIGLSIGGFRSAHLAGLDSRIKAAVVAGWMTTYSSLLLDHLRNHTWMIYVPQQLRYLDLPDVVSLNAPAPLMVVNCRKDGLFTMAGMQAAESQLSAVYKKLGAPERFKCNYYDVPHSFGIDMQNDAIAWLEKWL